VHQKTTGAKNSNLRFRRTEGGQWKRGKKENSGGENFVGRGVEAVIRIGDTVAPKREEPGEPKKRGERVEVHDQGKLG